MAEISRRSFVTKASIGAVAAGAVVAARPLTAHAGPTPQAATTVRELSEPVVAYVTDLRSGTVTFFHGEKETSVVDHALAQQLARNATA